MLLLQITKKVPLEKKAVEDVLGGEDEWKNVAKTEATCPKVCVAVPEAGLTCPCCVPDAYSLFVHKPDVLGMSVAIQQHS